MTKVVVSLTTIPPRFKEVHKTLRSILRQTARIDEINLYIARNYRRFDRAPDELPDVPDGVNVIMVDQDYGPATKVLPACRAHKGQDAVVIFCDDDRIYDPKWAQRLLDAAAQHPDAAICEEAGVFGLEHYPNDGWESAYQPKVQFRVKRLPYRIRRALTLCMWKPSEVISSGYADILEAWGGALVRPDMFDDASFDIPDVLWTVDDVWLSGCLARRGIPIWVSQKKENRVPEIPDPEVRAAALFLFVYKGFDRNAANAACIEYFRDQYGIWGGSKS